MQLEQDIQKQILDYLPLKGIFCWKNNTSGIWRPDRQTYIPSHAKGVSDILGILPGGCFLAIEVKRPGGNLTPHQEAFLSEIRERGGVGIVASSLEDVLRSY